jgi:hypothetical protein
MEDLHSAFSNLEDGHYGCWVNCGFDLDKMPGYSKKLLSDSAEPQHATFEQNAKKMSVMRG